MSLPRKLARKAGMNLKTEYVRFLTHPWQVSYALLFIAVGAGLFVALNEPNLGILGYFVLPWAVALTLGGVGMVVAAFWRGTEVFGRGIEKASLYLVASVWVSVSVLGLAGNDLLASTTPQALAVVLGAFGRIAALRRTEKLVTDVADREGQ